MRQALLSDPSLREEIVHVCDAHIADPLCPTLLEVNQASVGGAVITLPTPAEMLRRNATRDYLDFVALADHVGDEGVVEALYTFDELVEQLLLLAR